MPAKVKSNILIFEGCNYLKNRLILSTLSGKSVKIEDIRSQHDDPGIRDFELNLLTFLRKITNGMRAEVNETGTSLYYVPGNLEGGEFEHECSLQRSISYYLEVAMALAPFCKTSLSVKFKGITNNTIDPTIDRMKASGIPVLARFLGPAYEVELTIKKRGVAPLGGGEVHFKCPVIRSLRTLQLLDSGLVKRIRGVACSLRVSPAISNRLVESAKGVCLNFIPDVYIHTDASRGAVSGKSPGFGICLTAETTTGIVYCGEAVSPIVPPGGLPCIPEDLGKEAGLKLLDEIHRNGCVDSPFQTITALFMALGKQDISKINTGPLTPVMIQFLRDLKDFFGVKFQLESVKEDEDDTVTLENQVTLTCLGIGYSNYNKPAR